MISPPSRVRRKIPTMRLAASPRRRIISASISPEPRRISRASARSPGASSSPAAPTRRKFGASPLAVQATGRAKGTPSASLPKRSIGMISGSAGPATNFRLAARTSSPERPTRRRMSRSAGHSASPSPKARAISRVPTAPGLSRRNSISASAEGRARPGGLLGRRLNLSSLGPTRQQREDRIVAADQCFFLLTAPPLDLPFGSYGILNALETLLKHQLYWPPIRGVAVIGASLMFVDTPLQAIARRPDVIRAVGTAEDIKNSTHLIAAEAPARPSRRRFAPPQDE